MNDHLHALIQCTQDRWQPTIGDPHLMGWITVLGYGLAALAALTALIRTQATTRPTAEKLFWYLLVPGLVFLMINKQLDLQSLLTAVARCEAQLSGWYADRRPVQVAFIFALIALGTALLGILAWLLRQSLDRLWLVLLGITLLVTFILVRAVGFHRVDVLIGTELAGWRLNWLFELGGITLVILGCRYAIRRSD
ncbi:hypothetical protein ADINL_2379 [Nitrincola lacisaponensis]|uniref:Uncharacterized protein n=1 Tax=Nitrincola lacisaponensis TaxID=267850 RepID=A0A063Y260_9GAMM|nr:hypothetical protein [Nitrincola lacisaponensis]KDE39250.1 hypothetical protein ADINL_2379 [Nitrincola lacisaponensis]